MIIQSFFMAIKIAGLMTLDLAVLIGISCFIYYLIKQKKEIIKC